MLDLWLLTSERLIEKAAELGERLLQGPAAMIPRYEFLHDVRGQGLILASNSERRDL